MLNHFKCVYVPKQLPLLQNYSSNQDVFHLKCPHIHRNPGHIYNSPCFIKYSILTTYIREEERACTWLYDLARWTLNKKLPPIKVCHSYLEPTKSLHQADTLGHMKVTALTIEILQRRKKDATFKTLSRLCVKLRARSVHHPSWIDHHHPPSTTNAFCLGKGSFECVPHAPSPAAPVQCLLVQCSAPGQPPLRR